MSSEDTPVNRLWIPGWSRRRILASAAATAAAGTTAIAAGTAEASAAGTHEDSRDRW